MVLFSHVWVWQEWNTAAWEQRDVSSFSDETYGGGTPKTSVESYWDGNLPWIQSSDITEHKVFGVLPKKKITLSGLRNSSAKSVPANSIAIITRVAVGKLAFMPYEYATSQDFLSLSKLNVDEWTRQNSTQKRNLKNIVLSRTYPFLNPRPKIVINALPVCECDIDGFVTFAFNRLMAGLDNEDIFRALQEVGEIEIKSHFYFTPADYNENNLPDYFIQPVTHFSDNGLNENIDKTMLKILVGDIFITKKQIEKIKSFNGKNFPNHISGGIAKIEPPMAYGNGAGRPPKNFPETEHANICLQIATETRACYPALGLKPLSERLSTHLDVNHGVKHGWRTIQEFLSSSGIKPGRRGQKAPVWHLVTEKPKMEKPKK